MSRPGTNSILVAGWRVAMASQLRRERPLFETTTSCVRSATAMRKAEPPALTIQMKAAPKSA